MEKNMRYILIMILMLVFMWMANCSSLSMGNREIIISIACSILAPILAFFIDAVLSNLNTLSLWWASVFKYRNKEVRVSMAYLYRIQINGKFLLVKNSKYDLYQPVGGVYKVLSNDLGSLIEQFRWRKDNKYPDTDEKRCDLRGIIPSTKLIAFLRWYKLQKQRETSPWREFYEELIRKNVLRIEDFPFFEYRYLRTITTPIQRKINGNLEYYSFDIIDFIATPAQEKILIDTQRVESDYFKWVDELTISNDGRMRNGKVIPLGDHTKWIIK